MIQHITYHAAAASLAISLSFPSGLCARAFPRVPLKHTKLEKV